MRFYRCMAALVLSVAASFALATPDSLAERKLASASANLAKGRDLAAEVPKLKSNASRLDTLDRARYFLGRARTLSDGSESRYANVRLAASQSLVQVLDDQADIYYQRKSLSLAGKRVNEALAIDPSDSRARNLTLMIAAAKSTDVYSNGTGTVAIQRIRERRAAAGIPLRDRGLGLRR